MKWREWRMAALRAARGVVLVLLASLSCSAPPAPWQVYTFHNGSFALTFSTLHLPVTLSPFDKLRAGPCHHVTPSPCPLVASPPCHPATLSPAPPVNRPTWSITASTLADVTGDDQPEWALIVWRPWRDWPIQNWSSVPSPIAEFHDAAGESCHLILIDPGDGREIWAGSALPAPLLSLAVGDVDGDGHNEVAALEGDYSTGRKGPASHIGVWKWNGFGFTLGWRSPPGSLRQLCLTDADGDGILDIAVR